MLFPWDADATRKEHVHPRYIADAKTPDTHVARFERGGRGFIQGCACKSGLAVKVRGSG